VVHSTADERSAVGARFVRLIRALRPTDLPAFLNFRARAPANEALLGPAVRADGLSFKEFVGRSLALNPGRETWVHVEQGQLYGLVAARARFGTDVWDIDHLMVSPGLDDDRVCLRLLTHLCEAAVEEGVHKVFLRLPLDSPWLQPARQAGFLHYTTEHVLVLPTFEPGAKPVVPGLRPRRPADHQPLFQLYTSSVPGQVRQIEALTLQEWRWTDNWGFSSVVSLRRAMRRRRRDLVVQDEGRVTAWVQVETTARTIQILLDAGEAPPISDLLNRGLAELPPGRPVAFAMRDYQGELSGPLEERGFRQIESQALLAQMLTVRLPERRLVPARVV
jgi:hypothetical protein